MEAKMEAATIEAAQLAAKQVGRRLQPWIQREKEKHMQRAVADWKTWLRQDWQTLGS